MLAQLQQLAQDNYGTIDTLVVTTGNAALTLAKAGFDMATPYLQAFFAQTN